MRRGNRLADMNEVHMHTKAACKEQPAIRFRCMEERFSGVAVQKREHEHTQYRVSTDHFRVNLSILIRGTECGRNFQQPKKKVKNF
jgi:hypothetical protein